MYINTALKLLEPGNSVVWVSGDLTVIVYVVVCFFHLLARFLVN